MVFLEQIERKQRKLMEDMKDKKPSVRVVPASEITPEKGLSASSYIEGAPERRPAKTLALKPSAEVHDQLERLVEKTGLKSKKAVARQALALGIAQLERMHP